MDRPAHAYIFAGLEGVGKYKTAREWAKLLLCRSPQTKQGPAGTFADSCGSCESCTLLEADSHPDYAHVYKELLEYTKDGKGKKTPIDLPIDVIREFLIEQVAIRPTPLVQGRVFVLSEAEKLNANSQNALLKVLEEPPPHCTIILLCTRLEQLLPTTGRAARSSGSGRSMTTGSLGNWPRWDWRTKRPRSSPGWHRAAWGWPASGPAWSWTARGSSRSRGVSSRRWPTTR